MISANSVVRSGLAAHKGRWPQVSYSVFRRGVAGRGDNWASERLGLHMKNPMHGYAEQLVHLPGANDAKKHTFDKKFFRSEDCRGLLKIAYEGAVSLGVDNGQYIAIAKRYIRKGEIIERGIVRGIDPDGLDESVSNPQILRAGQDFLLGIPFSSVSSRLGPPFLTSGALMMYKPDHEHYNVGISVTECHVFGSFEFDAVALEDIPIGAPLKRRVASAVTASSPESPKYADRAMMNEDDARKFIEYQSEVDHRLAADAGISPPVMHTDAILEHVRMTASGALPILNCNRTVTLPHPVWGGYGVFASENIQAGEIVESGLHFRVNGLNGDKCPFVFTWNKGGKRSSDSQLNQWCAGSGNCIYYNSDAPANVRMYRFHDHFRSLIIANQDIAEGEEVMHLYASSSWRKCFVEDPYLPKVQPITD